MLTKTDALNFIKKHKKVAIVGLSPKTDRPSYRVGSFLIEKGFDIIPVNPAFEEILGKECVKSLGDLNPGDIDWIDLFVNPMRLMGLSQDIIQLSPKLVWCQLKIVNETFNQTMENENIPLIVDACPKIELGKNDV